MDCIFCRIIKGEIPCFSVYEDDSFLAFLDINPIKQGHTLVIPKQHAEDLFSMDEGLYHGMWDVAKKLSPVLISATEAKRVGVIVEGFLVPHAHVHLIPLHKGNELNPANARPSSREELEEMAGKIRNTMD